MKLFETLATAALLLLAAILMDVLLLEWAAGCGETYVDANGERHAYQCLFIR